MSNRLEAKSQGLAREIDILCEARASTAAMREYCLDRARHYDSTHRPREALHWYDRHGKHDDRVCEIDDQIEKRRAELEALENPPERPQWSWGR